VFECNSLVGPTMFCPKRLSLYGYALKIVRLVLGQAPAQDSHVSHSDEDPPHTHRMFYALKNVKDRISECAASD
jgi:hypothetical protein